MSKKRGRKSKQASESTTAPAVDRTPPWRIIYSRAADGSSPVLDFLDSDKKRRRIYSGGGFAADDQLTARKAGASSSSPELAQPMLAAASR